MQIYINLCKWRSRRAVDNYNLLRSYLWYDAESREITVEGYSETVQELYQSASVKGSMDTLPKTVGTVVICDNIIGIFVGDSYVVYAKSIAEGVVKESVSEGNWTARKRVLAMTFSLRNMTLL